MSIAEANYHLRQGNAKKAIEFLIKHNKGWGKEIRALGAEIESYNALYEKCLKELAEKDLEKAHETLTHLSITDKDIENKIITLSSKIRAR